MTGMQNEKRVAWTAAAALGLIMILGGVLRVIGIRFGLPMAYHNDEWILVLATKQFFSGDFNPHNFLYPSLLMYIMHFFERIYYLLMPGELDHSTLCVISRLTVVLFGVASIALLYKLGTRLHNRLTGLIAALLLAISPLHVINSHFATTDVPLAFFVLLTLWFTLDMLEKQRIRDYWRTGVAFGLTVSIKIPGAVIFAAILVAHLYLVIRQHGLRPLEILRREWRSRRRMTLGGTIAILAAAAVYTLFRSFPLWAPVLMRLIPVEIWSRYYDEILPRILAMAPKMALLTFLAAAVLGYTYRLWRPQIGRLLLLVCSALAAFFITTPFAILDFKAFAHDFLFQMVISQSSWSGMFSGKAPAYITNFSYLLDNFGLVFILAAAAGLLRQIGAKRADYWILITAGLVYYLYLGSWKIMFDRYMVPMLPLLAIWAAAGVVYAAELGRHYLAGARPAWRGLAITAGLVLLLILPAASMLQKSHAFDAYLLKTNTKKLAYDWAVTHLPREAHILREQYAPEVELDGYRVRSVYFSFNDSVNVDYIRRYAIDYVIVTDKLWKRPVQENGQLGPRKAYIELESYADLIWSIKPTPQNPGPEIRIYQIR